MKIKVSNVVTVNDMDCRQCGSTVKAYMILREDGSASVKFKCQGCGESMTLAFDGFKLQSEPKEGNTDAHK